MRLVDLSPEWIKLSVCAGALTSWREVQALAEADGICFLCPKCFAANAGPVGTHSVICWFVGKVAEDVTPGPGRWTPSGNDFSDLTFVPGTPPLAVSVQLHGGCNWHGMVSAGDLSILP